MSIYATLWILKFPRTGDYYPGCEWVEVIAQGVPAHIGSPSPGCGYESRDPYAAFLPPAVLCPQDESEDELDDSPRLMRAVVFVTSATHKGTDRAGQEYVDPLLVLSGEEYSRTSFELLERSLCDALRGNVPRLIGTFAPPHGNWRAMFADGTVRELPQSESDTG